MEGVHENAFLPTRKAAVWPLKPISYLHAAIHGTGKGQRHSHTGDYNRGHVNGAIAVRVFLIRSHIDLPG